MRQLFDGLRESDCAAVFDLISESSLDGREREVRITNCEEAVADGEPLLPQDATLETVELSSDAVTTNNDPGASFEMSVSPGWLVVVDLVEEEGRWMVEENVLRRIRHLAWLNCRPSSPGCPPTW